MIILLSNGGCDVIFVVGFLFCVVSVDETALKLKVVCNCSTCAYRPEIFWRNFLLHATWSHLTNDGAHKFCLLHFFGWLNWFQQINILFPCRLTEANRKEWIERNKKKKTCKRTKWNEQFICSIRTFYGMAINVGSFFFLYFFLLLFIHLVFIYFPKKKK